MTHYSNYQEWRHAIVTRGGLTLNEKFCKERIAIFQNKKLPETQTFLKMYGEEHLKKIISWFQKALSEL